MAFTLRNNCKCSQRAYPYNEANRLSLPFVVTVGEGQRRNNLCGSRSAQSEPSLVIQNDRISLPCIGVCNGSLMISKLPYLLPFVCTVIIVV